MKKLLSIYILFLLGLSQLANASYHSAISAWGYEEFLSLSTTQVANLAYRNHIGKCRIVKDERDFFCQYKVQIDGIGYPMPNACPSSPYARAMGCREESDFKNAGCLVKEAVILGICD